MARNLRTASRIRESDGPDKARAVSPTSFRCARPRRGRVAGALR